MNLAKIALLSESVATHVNVVGFDFDDSLSISETISLSIAALSEASNDIDMEYVYGKEILIEAAMFDNSKFDTLNEGLVGNFMASVRAFFVKIKEVLVGVYDKIKRRMALNTKSKSDFVTKIGTELKDKTSKSKEQFMYTGYAWNSSFLSDPSLQLSELSTKLNVQLSKAIDDIKVITVLDNVIANYAKTDSADKNDDIKKEKLAVELGVNFDNVLADITKTARKETKDDIKGFDKVSPDAMVAFIKTADDVVTKKITNVYEKAKADLDKLISACDKASKIDFKIDQLEGDERQAARDAIANFKAVVLADKNLVSFSIAFAQKYAAAVESLVDEASREFMRVLKAYALTKNVTK